MQLFQKAIEMGYGYKMDPPGDDFMADVLSLLAEDDLGLFLFCLCETHFDRLHSIHLILTQLLSPSSTLSSRFAVLLSVLLQNSLSLFSVLYSSPSLIFSCSLFLTPCHNLQ